MSSRPNRCSIAVRPIICLFMVISGCSHKKAVTPIDSGWVKQSSGTTKTINNVFFIDAQTGWAVGDDGLILSTSNAGQSWSKHTVGSGNLQGVAFVDAQHGWVVGGTNKIMHTSDGGQTWQPQQSRASEYLYGVAFLDRDTGWVVGNFGTIVGTTNGGTTWTLQQIGWDARLNAVGIFDARHVWALGPMQDTSTMAMLFRTEDGGANWTMQWGPGGWPVNADFITAKDGWVVNELSQVTATSDSGKSWTHLASPGFRGFDVDFIDSSTGWVVGCRSNGDVDSMQTNLIARTDDGGRSWVSQCRGPAWEVLLAVMFADAHHGWAVGRNGAIYHTSTGGQ